MNERATVAHLFGMRGEINFQHAVSVCSVQAMDHDEPVRHYGFELEHAKFARRQADSVMLETAHAPTKGRDQQVAVLDQRLVSRRHLLKMLGR